MPRRPPPTPETTAHYERVLRALARKRERYQARLDEVNGKIEETVREAFDHGVWVGPLKRAIGRSGSRMYQIKFAMREQEQDEAS